MIGAETPAGIVGMLPTSRSFAGAAAGLALALLASAIHPGAARAWGDKGHVIVAHLAARLLTPAARRQVAETLAQGESLESVAIWADVVRGSRDNPGERPETARWHYVNIPLGRSYDAARDCPEPPTPSCVVSAVAELQRTLAAERTGALAPAGGRYEALKFLVHLVGDLHQPLHSGDDGDAGGNLKTVLWLDGSVWKLHAVWDEALLAERMRRRRVSDPIAYADRLFAALSPRERAEAQPTSSSAIGRGVIEAWANASNALAVGAYADLGVADASGRYRLDERYYERHGAEVDEQLTRAGIRLARILNETLR